MTAERTRRGRLVARIGLWSAYPARTRPLGLLARWVPPLVALFLGLLAWWLVAQQVPASIVADPTQVGRRLLRWISTGVAWRYLLPTLGAALLGSLIAVVTALPLGYAIAHSRLLGAVAEPFIAFSQTVPLVAVAPLLVLWVGYGTFPIALLCAVIAFFPMVTTTVLGFRGLDMRTIETAWLDGANGWQRLIHVEAPVAAPAVLAGVRAGVVLSMMGAIVGEFVMGGQGLGTLLTISREAADTTGVFAAVILISLAAAGLAAVLPFAERSSARRVEGTTS
ncbi:MAG: ABC transporter permease subunit [Propionibacteriaceae bacterium]|nr:ABC transporter permease subunit [Propionibacteriaceae bacterium]